MNTKTLSRLAAAWQIDENDLFEAFQAANAAIEKHLGDKHPECRVMHVASLLLANAAVVAHARLQDSDAVKALQPTEHELRMACSASIVNAANDAIALSGLLD